MVTDPFEYARRGARRTEPDDPLVADFQRERNERIAYDIKLTNAAPDELAKSRRLSRETDLPAPIVIHNIDTVEKRQSINAMIAAVNQFPSLGRWVSTNKNATLVTDDIHGVTNLAKKFDPVEWTRLHGTLKPSSAKSPTALNTITGLLANFAGGIWDIQTGLAWSAIDAGIIDAGYQFNFGPGPLIQRLSKEDLQQRYIDNQIAVNRASPRFHSREANAAFQGGASLLRQTPGIAASIATRSSIPALVNAGVNSAAPAYAKYRVRGGTAGEAATGALLEGGIEVATEKLPMGIIVEAFGKAGATKFLRDYLAREMPTEQVATFAQDAVDTAIANPEKTWGQFAAERPGAAYDTAISTLTSTGAIAGLSTGVERLARGRTDQARAEAGAIFLDKLMESSAESKLKSRDPEAFKELIRQVSENSPVDSVFIPATAVREYMQSEMYSESEFFSGLETELTEAETHGGDIVIPIEDALEAMAGTPAYDALKDHIRLTAGGVSKSEADLFNEAVADQVQTLGEEIEADLAREKAARAPRERLLDKMRSDLQNVGYSPDAAQAQAELVTARVATRSARLGRDLEGNELDNLSIRQVLPERLRPVLQKADDLDIAIAGLRGTLKDEPPGQSLVEFISRSGGVRDTGGELRDIGLNKWRKPGFKSPYLEKKAAGFFGIGTDSKGLDDVASAAALEGFIAKADTDLLIEAIAEEVGGNPVYREEDLQRGRTFKDGIDDLANFLGGLGLDPSTASKAEIETSLQRYQEDEISARVLFQSINDGARGKVGFDGNKAVISLFEGRDLSTFIHEMGHVWLEELKADAALDNAPAQIKEDWSFVADWFAINGYQVDKTIPDDAHELWARGVERFIMEGKPPSGVLDKVFHTFRSWMLAVYRAVENLRAPISPEIRDVMARMLATDTEIAEAAEAQGLKALFDNAEIAGMTEKEFRAYRQNVESARDAAYDNLLVKVMGQVRRKREKEYREVERGIEKEIAQDVDNRPEYRALNYLRNVQAMDKGTVFASYGSTIGGNLPVRVLKDGGIDPDEAAQMTGFDTGDDMIKALMGIETERKRMKEAGDKRSPRQALIDYEVEELMRHRYGDILSDGSIEEEALASLHDERQGEIIAAELRTLSRRTSQEPTPYKIAKDWAADKIAAGVVTDVISRQAIQRYARAAAKAVRAAEAAMIEQNIDEAYKQKRIQMLNNALISEAKKRADQTETAIKRLSEVSKKRTMKSVDQDYLEQAQALLQSVDILPQSQRRIDARMSFEEWAESQSSKGYDLVVPSSFASRIGKKHWSRLTVEELIGLDEAVKQIMHLGRTKQTLLDNQKQREFDAVVNEAVDNMLVLQQRPADDLTEPSNWDSLKAGVISAEASLVKAETIFDRLDSQKADGVFNRVIFKRISDAQDREQAMIKDYIERLNGLIKAIPKATIRRWSQKITIPELQDPATGLPVVTNREKLISMALNMGNESNTAKLVGGYGWDENALMRVLNRELTDAEWHYVQKVWDTIGSLWPEIEAMEKRLNGVAPEKIRPRSLDTKAGKLRGGYFPVVYDASRDFDAEINQARNSDMFENTYRKAATSRGFVNERTAVERPIHLSLGNINRHVGEVIHDLTHREAVIDADRFISDRRIMRAMDNSIGPAERKQLRPWLQHIANEWAVDNQAMQGWERWISRIRTNATMVGLGFRASTMMMQAAGYSNSFERVGAKHMAPAIAKFWKNPLQTSNFVLERSGEVRNRMSNLDRDIRDAVRKQAGKSDLISDAQRFAFMGIGYMDRAVSVPTWLAAYNKALAFGKTETQSVYEGDKAVRQSQGSGAAKDLAAVQRGRGKAGEAMKLLTMFYSYMSAFYQRQRLLVQDSGTAIKSRDVEAVPGLLARAWWLIILPPVLAELLAGRGPDEDEDPALWAIQRMMLQSVGPIPVARDVASSVDSGFGYSFTPAEGLGRSAVGSIKDTVRIVQGEDTKRATRNYMEMAGYFTGLVPGQVAASTQFIIDVAYGEQDPDGIGEWIEGLAKGKIK